MWVNTRQIENTAGHKSELRYSHVCACPVRVSVVLVIVPKILSCSAHRSG